MKAQFIAGLILAGIGLAGCGANAKMLMAVAVAKATGGAPAAAGAAGSGKGEQLVVALPSQGRTLQLSAIEHDGNVTTWATPDGLQIMLRDGMIIQTRGLGLDLMSAAVPSRAQILGGKAHSRAHYYLAGSDDSFRRDYNCDVTQGAPEAALPQARHLVEACSSDAGTIANDYYFVGQRLVLSRQWVSQGVGYAQIASNGK